MQIFLAGGNVCGALATSLLAARVCLDLATAAAAILCVFSFEFIAELSNMPEQIRRWSVRGMALVAGVLSLLCLVEALWPLSWIWMVRSGPQGVITIASGPMLKLLLTSARLMNLMVAAVSVLWFVRARGLHRQQAFWIMLSLAFSWIGHLLANLPGYSAAAPQPISFALSSLTITWAFYRWRVLGLLTLAHEVTVRKMIDGLVVLDEEQHLAAMNPIARGMFSVRPAEEHRDLRDLIEEWPQLAPLRGMAEDVLLEVERIEDGHMRIYQVRQIGIPSCCRSPRKCS